MFAITELLSTSNKNTYKVTFFLIPNKEFKFLIKPHLINLYLALCAKYSA
jgi:hypothetical protein